MAKTPGSDEDRTSDLERFKDRTTDEAATQATMLERILKEKAGSMPPELESQMRAELLSARGQLDSAAKRAEAERRAGKKPER